MKKIGILNFQYSNHNYGAVLQAAALEYICRELGHDVQHLDYEGKQQTTLKSRLVKLLGKIGLRSSRNISQVANEEAFERFRQRFISRTKRIKSAKEFPVIAKSFDAVIVGSDQVWRPVFSKDPIAFFLGYVPPGIERIAYAASFGTSTWEHANTDVLTVRAQRELRKFKAVSCREESGVKICQNIFGVDALHVLDPLLLVDDAFFDKVSGAFSAQRVAKLIYYKLDATLQFQEDLKALAADLGSKAVNIYCRDSGIHAYREVSDWLGMIRNADVVVTDSFHCICLALRFGKSVIYCPNEYRGKARMDSLFKMLNIKTEPLRINLSSPMFNLTASSDIQSILESERTRSLKYLVNAFNG